MKYAVFFFHHTSILTLMCTHFCNMDLHVYFFLIFYMICNPGFSARFAAKSIHKGAMGRFVWKDDSEKCNNFGSNWSYSKFFFAACSEKFPPSKNLENLTGAKGLSIKIL